MSTDDAGAWSSVAATTCPVCDGRPPAADFCGTCGARLAETRRRFGDGPAWLRLRAYAAAPTQHVLIPSLTSLFPRLPCRSRGAFAMGMLALAVLLAVAAALRWQGPLIGLCALGLPLLFVLYLNESDAFADLPVRILLALAGLEVVLSVGYSLFTGAIVADTYDNVLGTPLTVAEQLVTVLAVPFGEVLVMLLPLVLIWVLVRRRPDREALDGFALGAFAALCFCAAGTFTRLAPQFETGLVATDRPITAFLVTSIIEGVAVPVTAAAVTGLFGATLWLRPRRDGHHRFPRYWFVTPAPAFVVGVLAYVGIGWLDIRWLPQAAAAVAYTVIAVLAVLALRIGVHGALLDETPEVTDPDTTVLCPQCDHVVPDLAFCPGCGVAGRASSRTSRRTRRAQRPVPLTAPEGQ